MSPDYSTILFLCTGNYYRSRFAELLFNAYAVKFGLPWRADSRALALERGIYNFGPIARSVLSALAQRGLPVPEPVRFPLPLTDDELRSAKRVVALKEAEHRPLLAERHPSWVERVEYWHIHDNDVWTVEQTLTGIENHIRQLVAELRGA